MTNTRQHTTLPSPDPVLPRLVLKCRCGGLYVNANAHREAYGHRPEPIAPDVFCRRSGSVAS